jgi:arylsulfatase A-like enzyme
VDELRDTGLLDKTLVVITSDHGEMLGDNGGPLGHGWRVTPQLANVPLILMDPEKRGYRVNDAVGSQVDLLPTLLDVLGLPLPVGELYQGQSLYAAQGREGREIYLNSYDEFAVIAGQEIHTGSRKQETGDQPEPAAVTYQISNSGSKTMFTATNLAEPFMVSIKRFDEFQTGFLENYAFYRDSLPSRQTTNLVHLAR